MTRGAGADRGEEEAKPDDFEFEELEVFEEYIFEPEYELFEEEVFVFAEEIIFEQLQPLDEFIEPLPFIREEEVFIPIEDLMIEEFVFQGIWVRWDNYQ